MHITAPETLEVLLSGMSHYVDIGASSDAVMTYMADGKSHIRLPDGKIMHGTWSVTQTGYQVAWEGGPAAGWRFEHAPGVISYIDANDKNHGPITRIVPGDPEGLSG